MVETRNVFKLLICQINQVLWFTLLPNSYNALSAFLSFSCSLLTTTYIQGWPSYLSLSSHHWVASADVSLRMQSPF